MGTDPRIVLRDRGITVTAQRFAVLRAVSAHPHSTADEVAEAATAEIGAISRRAVYDVLGVLVDHGLIRRLQRGVSRPATRIGSVTTTIT